MLNRHLTIILLCLAILAPFATANDGVEIVKSKNAQQLQIQGQTIRTTSATILNAKDISIENSVVRAASWSEQTLDKVTSFFAISLDGKNWTAAKETSNKLQLKHGSIDPLQIAVQKVEANLQSRSNSNLHIIQFRTQSLEAYRQTLTKMGVKLHKFLPFNSHVATIDAKILETVKSLSFVRWVGPMHPAYKLENASVSKKANNDYNVVVVDLNNKKELMSQIVRLGGQVVNEEKGNILLVAKLNSQQLQEVAHLDTVLWIDKATAIEEDMDNARIQGGADHIEGKGGFTGIGIRGHVLEGIYDEHPDFKATKHRQRPIPIDLDTAAGHGQNTYGQIFGDGSGKKDARGLLPDAQGYFTNYRAVYNGSGTGKGSRYELVGRLIKEHKVMFQTASWGYGRTRSYTSRSAEMDKIIFDHDMPITQSQSNAGNQDSRPQAWAKNIISVGGLRHFNNSNPGDDKWNRSASIGPASDGRFKPDLCAYYDSISTTAGSSGYTSSFGGTSGATPIVAGHVGLTVQLWTDGVFGNTLKAPKSDRFANRPHYTTVKAILIASAAQYEFSGANHDRTRVHQGWGFPSVRRMFENRSKMLIVNEEHVLKNLQSKSYTVNVAAGQPELKFTMVYTDPEANVSSSIHRINNLDLKVTAPDGTVYWGNNGLKESMFSKAGGSANKLDTVENVFIKNPAVGTWKVEVIADEVNADTHKETSETDVDYALVVFGIAK